MQRPLLKEIDPTATGHKSRMTLMNQEWTSAGVSSGMYECEFTCARDTLQALSFVLRLDSSPATRPDRNTTFSYPASRLLYPIWYNVSWRAESPSNESCAPSCLRV